MGGVVVRSVLRLCRAVVYALLCMAVHLLLGKGVHCEQCRVKEQGTLCWRCCLLWQQNKGSCLSYQREGVGRLCVAQGEARE